MNMFENSAIRNANNTIVNVDSDGVPIGTISKAQTIADFQHLLKVYADSQGSAEAMNKACGGIASIWQSGSQGIEYAAKLRHQVERLFATRTLNTPEDYQKVYSVLMGA